jgi:hypothetical protein
MPQGDPAGYLPNVKKKRKLRGYKTRKLQKVALGNAPKKVRPDAPSGGATAPSPVTLTRPIFKGPVTNRKPGLVAGKKYGGRPKKRRFRRPVI